MKINMGAVQKIENMAFTRGQRGRYSEAVYAALESLDPGEAVPLTFDGLEDTSEEGMQKLQRAIAGLVSLFGKKNPEGSYGCRTAGGGIVLCRYKEAPTRRPRAKPLRRPGKRAG